MVAPSCNLDSKNVDHADLELISMGVPVHMSDLSANDAFENYTFHKYSLNLWYTTGVLWDKNKTF